MHTDLYVPAIGAGMSDTCMNPDVECTLFKIGLYEILIMLGIRFMIKTDFFYKAVILNLTHD